MRAALRFEAADHAYFLNDVRIPSVTQMLKATGWIDDAYYSEAGRERGSAVHAMTAAYDLGALDLDAVVQHRGYVLAYIEAMRSMRATWDAIEEIAVHPGYRFAGKPDRVGSVFGVQTIPEIKTGGRERWHSVQTALQAILINGARGGLPATSYRRASLYLKKSGWYTLEDHPNRRDFDHAYRVLATCCPQGDRR